MHGVGQTLRRDEVLQAAVTLLKKSGDSKDESYVPNTLGRRKRVHLISILKQSSR
jgi:hypothetical protein